MIFLLLICASRAEALQTSGDVQSTTKGISSEIQKERDHILSLLVLAFVHNDWQTAKNTPRGHNIGSLLVDADGMPVFWTRNSVKLLNNSTQHGEVRLATRYLSNLVETKYMPKGYVLYTSLEPCAMCTGMLSMIETQRVVFVQQDPEFGHVTDALNAIKYPRVYAVDTPGGMVQKKELESGYDAFSKAGGTSITNYLLTPEAEKIYASAGKELTSYSVKYPENASVLQAARALSHSRLPELTGETSRAQNIWQIRDAALSIPDNSFHPTLFAYYSGWNGEKNVAQLYEGAFYVCTTNGCRKADSVAYLNGNKKWTVRLKHGLFEHTPKDAGQAGHQDGIVIYKDWKNKDVTGTFQQICFPD